MSRTEIHKAVRSLRWSFWILAGLSVFVLSTTFLDRYEGILFPVGQEFQILTIDPKDDHVVVSGELVKLRDCRLIGLSWYVGDRNHPDAPRERLSYRVLPVEKNSDIVDGVGRRAWGPWRIDRPVQVRGPSVFMRASHACHPLFPTTAIYFERPAAELFGPEYH